MTNCSFCSEEVLVYENIDGLSFEKLAMLRNEIFARRGYVFANEFYQNYFEGMGWYSRASSNDDVKLTKIETDNINFLKAEEARLQKIRNKAIADLKRLKNALNTNNKTIIDEFMEGEYVNDFSDINLSSESLKKILSKIDINNINWNNGKALYRITIDNGYNISGYEIYIVGNEITIRGGDYSHSAIFGDFNDGFSDYQSEIEYVEWWVFKMTEEGIQIIESKIAG